ncbi:MAG: zinc-binding dehydrogenase [Bacteroidetes bacterium]|jgi:2-desacetyl-2-hydroxyethyl bacteriochlorophyllide A dehydrogenase|nr:zinc-binding dehydrogenase [Bacteroidota bacterium]
MKAAIINRYGTPEVIEITDINTPEPASDQVLIRVYATSINPIDLKTRKGNLKYILGSDFPIILGYDAAGEIVQTGKKVKHFHVGDRVFTRLKNKYGQAMAEYAVAHEEILARIPESVSYEQAAAYPLASITALQALRNKADINKYKRVLIIGATGGVGHFAVQIARIFNAHVTAYCGPGHEKILMHLKPNEVIRYHETNVSEISQQFDIVFDAAGKTSFLACNQLVKKGGTYIAILPRPKLLFHKIVGFIRGKQIKTLIMRSVQKDMDWICDQITKGKLVAHIDKTYSLENASQAHEYAEKGHTEGKIIITIP